MSSKILLVDDDYRCRKLLTSYLSEQGCRVNPVESESVMEGSLLSSEVDLIILDLAKSPGLELSVARHLRGRIDTPIIIISNKSDEIDRIVGLEVGADDYMVKPVNPRELLARVRAVMRRKTVYREVVNNQVVAGESNQGLPQKSIKFSQYTPWLESLTLTKRVDEREVNIMLTSVQFKILQLFAEHAGRIMSRNYIATAMGDESEDGRERRVDVMISRIRKKIESNPRSPQFIKTVRGQGYRFAV
ncbi:MAG: response regulator transcription factor [Thiotrichales bacterium]|jgi:DNA-binding response OmpR family regulator|nr:response regulator transcription factor [Thiotrichales bacterium]MBT3613797.1 response regulator transcription factor [Thiotrichales bacterium]MBT3753237.1 response regulator transcription factor [Thiotrichales bacterium]MBT3837858.1 response regulator transcription factor [Thiotrichales bacterium]MBT4152089.1 response regulator transcription factor [Thiotrichales bacterium]